LPAILLVLTAVTGVVDAVSYLRLGHVFVANMTGNVAFLGFAVADAREFSVAASLTAALAFLAGAVLGGRLVLFAGRHRGRYLAAGILIEAVLVAAALAAALFAPQVEEISVRYELIVLLALAMGLQNAVARKLGVPDLTTTVLTLTLTGLAADSRLGGGDNPRTGRRLLATASMFAGAAVGTVAIFRFGVGAALATALALLAACGAMAAREARSTEPWAQGA
jgi:uncharacterized membrane protein YoaK (UPF0700 family)